MGKVPSTLAVAAFLLAMTLTPSRPALVHAQTSPSLSCAAQPPASPMQGHYTGHWRSDATYHFTVNFPPAGGYPAETRDLELQIVIDGTLDVRVSPDGQVSGQATGKVDAPITHDGTQDISSGTGTISGQLSGSLSATTAALALSHPVIDMQWGTFEGHVERWITMPDYQLSPGSLDCVSAQGTISEQGFPVQNITNDSTGQLTQAAGVGTASGTWQLSGDQAAKFQDLSRQVDSVIGAANALLGDSSVALTPALVDQKIVQPLKSLEETIRQDPSVSRCLLDRMGAWEASVLPTLFRMAQSIADPTGLPALRRSADLLRSARLLDLECSLGDGGAEAAVLGAESTQLDRLIAARDWPGAALLIREILLLEGDGARNQLQQQVRAGVHSLLAATSAGAAVLEIARIAYALGDDADAGAAYKQLTGHLRSLDATVPWTPSTPTPKKHKSKKSGRKRGKRGRPVQKPAPTPKPTATSTPTPAPKTLQEVLASGVPSITTGQTSGSDPTLSWQPVAAASRYLVFVTAPRDPKILWSWSGSGSSATYGDTALAGTPGTTDDGWSVPLPANASWSVLALDAQGQIVGLKLRISLST